MTDNGEHAPLSLDDLYRMTANVYREQNAGRSPESTFSHFVEVCGMLTRQDRNKPTAEIDSTDALCKALGWFFPLMAKFRVRSLQDLIFRKYPYACPYCRQTPHNDIICKNVVGSRRADVQHEELKTLRATNQVRRPTGLDQWQAMFQEIYPRSVNDQKGRSTLGLMEELGELAEAIRVFEDFPEYLAGEAADVFSYLMGAANEYALRAAREEGPPFSLEAEYIRRYPGLCLACGYPVCRCPNIPDATVGRLAKELPLEVGEELFSAKRMSRDTAELLAGRALKQIGGWDGLIVLPLDRGGTNRRLVEAIMRLAETLEQELPNLAESLRRNAFKLMQSTTEPGARNHSARAVEAVQEVNALLSSADISEREDVQRFGADLVSQVTTQGAISILFVSACPLDQERIRTDAEARIVAEAIERAQLRDRFTLDTLTASTVDSFRRAQLERRHTIVHFAGHGEPDHILFEDESGVGVAWYFADLAEYLKLHPSTECLILNACFSAGIESTEVPMLTIAMPEKVDDPAAIAFARGFYDALGVGRGYELAISEGVQNARAQGHRGFDVAVLRPQGS